MTQNLTHPLGLRTAGHSRRGAGEGLCGKLQIRFTFSTNGQGIYGIDMETGVEGEIARYPTPDELRNLAFAKQQAFLDFVLFHYVTVGVEKLERG